VTGPPNLSGIAQEVESSLGEMEGRLLSLIQEGARGAREPEDVITGLAQVGLGISQQYRRVHEALERRDLPFHTVEGLESTRKRSLWLYRKIRLEQVFFSRLRLERSLRDTIFREIIETCQEMSSLEDTERDLRSRDEDALAAELLEEPDAGAMPFPPPGIP
jgi:hypothetical protein